MKNNWEKGEEYATEFDNICDAYLATLDTLYQYIMDWEDNNNKLMELQSETKRNQKREKQAITDLKSSTSDWRTIFCKTLVQKCGL